MNLISSQQQEILAKSLATQFNGDVQLDLVMIPFTTVSEAEAQQQSDIDYLTDISQQFVKTLYHDAAFILDIDYISEPQQLVVANMYADKPFDKDIFEEQYKVYLIENTNIVNNVFVNRQTGYEIMPTTTPQLERYKQIMDNVTSFFPASYVEKLLVDYDEDQHTLGIQLWLGTSADEATIRDKITTWKLQLGEIYPDDVITVSSYIDYLTKLE